MSPESILAIIVVAPGILFAVLALAWLLGAAPGERVVAKLTGLVFSVVSAGALWLGWTMWSNGSIITTPAIPWFHVGAYHFELSLVSDKLSWPMITLTSFLVGLVGVFSVRYLHRDRGYLRFFLLLNLFAFGALLVLSAGSFDLLLVGWEMVGISSVLLVSFFDQRPDPVRNGVRVFAFYRVADLGLLIGLFCLHTFVQTTSIVELFAGSWPNQGSYVLHGSEAALVGLLLLVAAAGKSAQAPFSGWLPRAMEGPTPSSAIFYGAISVHLGAYLLLRAEPILRTSPWASGTVAVVGGVTALFATLIHRASTDAKASLAYAGMAQVGIIFVEIALGYPQLALAHMMGHAVVRTLQFLRAPSMLHDYHRVHSAAGGNLDRTGEHYERLLPESVRLWLYRAAVDRGYYDALLDRVVTAPFLRIARRCEALELGLAKTDMAPQSPLLKEESQLAERMES